jgi:hypothetical protein
MFLFTLILWQEKIEWLVYQISNDEVCRHCKINGWQIALDERLGIKFSATRLGAVTTNGGRLRAVR